MLQDVYLVAGKRTVFIKMQNKLNRFLASDLAVLAGQSLLLELGLSPTELDEVIVGCVIPDATEANIGRIVSLRLGCGNQVPAWTVARNCASGLQSIDSAYKDIASGRHQIVLAGGTEAMSRAPFLFSDKAVNWFLSLKGAKSFSQKLKILFKFRPKFFVPEISLLKGLADAVIGLNMGQTAEILADKFQITRQEMDSFAKLSHDRAAQAYLDNIFKDEVLALSNSAGKLISQDNGIRAGSTLEKLAKLKPVFDKKFGNVTAGNSSQITDGACMLVLASKSAVDKYKLNPLAKIVDISWAALDPKLMGLGPVHATANLLQKNNLKMEDIDYWEINEAFAAQVLACIKAMQDKNYCQENFGMDQPLGNLDLDRLNIDGGAIAMGHPVGASGARITLHMMNTLKRKNSRRGIATMCIGGGQGGAILIERVS